MSFREQDAGGRYWSSRMKDDPERATGSVVHRSDGHFDFDLPLSKPKVNELSESDRTQGVHSGARRSKSGGGRGREVMHLAMRARSKMRRFRLPRG